MNIRQTIVKEVAFQIDRWNAPIALGEYPKQKEFQGKIVTVTADPICSEGDIWQSVREWQLKTGNQEAKKYLNDLSERGVIRLVNDISKKLVYKFKRSKDGKYH